MKSFVSMGKDGFLEYHFSLNHGKRDKEWRCGSKITKQIPPKMNMPEIGGNIAKRRWNVEGNVHLQEMGKKSVENDCL